MFNNQKSYIRFLPLLILGLIVFAGIEYSIFRNDRTKKDPQEELSNNVTFTPSIAITPSGSSKMKGEPIEISEQFKETEDTISWKTYAGSGFSIKYPNDSLFSNGKRADNSVELSYYEDKSGTKKEIIRITVSKKPTTIKNISEMESPFSLFVKIGNLTALGIYSDNNPADFCVIYNLINNNRLFTLSVTNPSDPSGGSCDITYLRQILSTFRFTGNLDKKCGSYVIDEVSTEYCAICGNGVCEEKERCSSSECSNEVCLSDCGPVYCPADCK